MGKTCRQQHAHAGLLLHLKWLQMIGTAALSVLCYLHVLIVTGTWQLPNAAQLLHRRTAADADGLGVHQVADLEQVQCIQIVQVWLVCQVDGGVLVRVD